MKQIKIGLACVALIWAGALTAGSSVAPQQQTEIPPVKKPAYDLKVSSPIFRSDNKRIDLDVKIPNIYRPIQTAQQAARLKLLQFIPKNETPQSWTKMIVLQIVGNQGLSSAQFTQIIAQKVKEKSNDATILINESKSENDYTKSALGVVYDTGKRRELSYMEYFSSEKHLSGIQYVRIIQPDEDAKAILEKMVIEVHKIAQVTTKDPKAKPSLQVHWDNMIQMDYPFSENGLLVHSNVFPNHWADNHDANGYTMLYPTPVSISHIDRSYRDTPGQLSLCLDR